MWDVAEELSRLVLRISSLAARTSGHKSPHSEEIQGSRGQADRPVDLSGFLHLAEKRKDQGKFENSSTGHRGTEDTGEAEILHNFASSFPLKVCTLAFLVPVNSGRAGGEEEE